MRKTIIILVLIAITAVVLITYLLLKEPAFENALDAFEDGNYVKTIHIINVLVPRTDYNESEKMLYYRIRAINALADELEKEYDKELIEAALEKKGTPGFEEAFNEIQAEINDINNETGGDLTLLLAKNKSCIISQGSFYNEFTSKYRGSSYIEDLDYLELQRQIKTGSENIPLLLLQFYQRYPDTTYMANIVNGIFEHMRSDPSLIKGNTRLLMDLFTAYGRKFPTSPEIKKLYTVIGNNINLRNSPGTDSSIVSRVQNNDIVIEVEKSMDTMQIGNNRDYWYRIITLSGDSGWLFGSFLKPMDIQRHNSGSPVVAWAMEEYFNNWQDSHTPENWNQVVPANAESLGFYQTTTGKILRLEKGRSTAGLFSRFSTKRDFILETRARYCGGSPLIAAYVLPDGKTFSLKLGNEFMEISGRKVPMHTSDWHVYSLESSDGKYARLLLDGEVISGRLEPLKLNSYDQRGIYILNSDNDPDSCGEIDYIKVR